jgi:hypothetical protein
MRIEEHPYKTQSKKRFPNLRILVQMEGGSVALAEKDDRFYIIIDESTLADFLDGEDEGLREVLVHVYEFETDSEREEYIEGRGWNRFKHANK